MSLTQSYLACLNKLGEGPLYDYRINVLFWVDIYGCEVHWIDYAKPDDTEYTRSTHKLVKLPASVGVLGLTRTPFKLVAASNNAFVAVDLRKASGKGEALTPEILYFPPSLDKLRHRFNDGIVDPRGSFLAGTTNDFGQKVAFDGHLFRYNGPNTKAGAELDIIEANNVGTANGIGFSPDNKTFYFTDTERYAVYQYDYDISTGAATNKRIFLQANPKQLYGSPDGLVISTDGHVWVAFWNGHRLDRFDTQGQLVERFTFPTSRITCPEFCGPDLDELIVTSAGQFDQPPEAQDGIGGNLFRIKVQGVKGLPRNIFNMD